MHARAREAWRPEQGTYERGRDEMARRHSEAAHARAKRRPRPSRPVAEQGRDQPPNRCTTAYPPAPPYAHSRRPPTRATQGLAFPDRSRVMQGDGYHAWTRGHHLRGVAREDLGADGVRHAAPPVVQVSQSVGRLPQAACGNRRSRRGSLKTRPARPTTPLLQCSTNMMTRGFPPFPVCVLTRTRTPWRGPATTAPRWTKRWPGWTGMPAGAASSKG